MADINPRAALVIGPARQSGMNEFFEAGGFMFLCSVETKRPRINKIGSQLDKHQKEIGEYYYAETAQTENA